MKKEILSVCAGVGAVPAGAELREDSEKKYGAFYGEKQTIDVFFLGTSHVMGCNRAVDHNRLQSGEPG